MNNPAVKYGLYYGLFFVLYNTFLKFIAPQMIFTGSVSVILGIAIPIICMVLAGREVRDQEEGYLSFGEALKNTFLVFVIGSLISTLYQYILVNFIDPGLLEVQREAVLEMGDWLTNMMGESEEAAEEMREKMEEAADASMHQTFGQVILGWMGSLIIGIILSAIISAFIKKTN